MLHPDFSYVLFTDEDILAFIRERTPSWLPLYKGLTHHAIQRVDLFRYLAIYYYGGLYLDLDLLLTQPLHALLQHQAVFPFEPARWSQRPSALLDDPAPRASWGSDRSYALQSAAAAWRLAVASAARLGPPQG